MLKLNVKKSIRVLLIVLFCAFQAQCISVGFLNYLHSTPVLTDGGIAVELSSMGYSSPKFSYPPTTSAVSAGDWNVAAAQNSRLSFSFTPE